MNKIIIQVLTITFLVSSGFGFSSDVMGDTSEIRVIAQSIVIHAAENGETVSIPYEEFPSVRHSIATLRGGSIAFPVHENYAFPPADPVPVVFFECIGWVLVGMSDGDVRYFKNSEPPQWGMAYTFRAMFKEVFIRFSPILNLLLLVGILIIWFVRRFQVKRISAEEK